MCPSECADALSHSQRQGATPHGPCVATELPLLLTPAFAPITALALSRSDARCRDCCLPDSPVISPAQGAERIAPMLTPLLSRWYARLAQAVDWMVGWTKLPPPLGAATLLGMRR